LSKARFFIRPAVCQSDGTIPKKSLSPVVKVKKPTKAYNNEVQRRSETDELLTFTFSVTLAVPRLTKTSEASKNVKTHLMHVTSTIMPLMPLTMTFVFVYTETVYTTILCRLYVWIRLF